MARISKWGCGPPVLDISIYDGIEDVNIKVVKQHLAACTDVNAKGGGEWTPLHDAVGLPCQKEIVELLIAAGADVNAQRDDGITPLDWGEEVNEDDSPEDKTDYKELAVLIRKRGGKTGEELKAQGK